MAAIEQVQDEQPEQTQPVPSSSSNLSATGDIKDKFDTAKGHKEKGDAAFLKGEVGAALTEYHTALLYLKGLDKNAAQKALGQPVPQPPPIDASSQPPEPKITTAVDELAEKIYGNMSQCHLKKGNWHRAIATADDVLRIRPDNYKAMFRKAKALKEQGYFEKAEKLLEQIIKDGPEADKVASEEELQDVRRRDKELTAQHNQKMKGFLNKDKVDLSKD